MPAHPTCHIPVLASEVLDWLQPAAGMRLVDGTLGGGGHARLLAERVGDAGTVLAVDRDPAALGRAEIALAGLPLKVAQANFCELPDVLAEVGWDAVDGILLDLGLSSDQLADEQRGFSFDSTGPLDLRFDPTTGKSAAYLVNTLRPENLADLIFQYGEERFSRRIAAAICRRRADRPIENAAELADVVRSSVPRGGRIDGATRTFQALRIAVNEELRSLEIALRQLPNWLRPGGRLAIISFHSLEDRLVKEAFRDDPRLENLTRRPVTAGDVELAANPRSRSAKLRVAGRRVS